MNRLDNATAAIASVRRVASAERHAQRQFDVEWCPLVELAPITEDWRALAAQALEPNVFYDPAFALAAAPLLGTDVRAALVWSRAPRQLVGFFPMRSDRRRYGLPFAVMTGWTHPYAPFGVPLVHRDMAEPVIASWLEQAARDPSQPGLVLMPMIAQSGAFAAALADVLARRGCLAASFGRYERALLQPGDARADYLKRHVSGKRLRYLRRCRRQLAECGTLTVEQAENGGTLCRALGDFFALETAGWKGRAGTAAAQHEAVRDFMQRAVMALGADGKAIIHRLLLDGKAIAATMTLKSRDTAWGWKISYDEAYASFSPGVLLMAGLTEALLADPQIARMDSCASASDSEAMISHLWKQKLTIADWLFTIAPGGELSFRLASRLEGLRRAAIAAAKSARDHLRRR